MARFERVIDKIYRLKVPFDKIYTSVFLVGMEDGYLLVDCATTKEDVTQIILPAIREERISLSDVKRIVVSHHHEDHAGGLPWIVENLPRIEVVKEVTLLADGIDVYPMPGHTRDCIGVLDHRSKTLISADGIQGYGVDRYPCSLHDEPAYLRTLQEVLEDARVENILFAHAYEPWEKDFAFGIEEKKKCIRDSLEYLSRKNR